MKGTEKQIAWANDIIDNIKEIFKAAEEAQPDHPMIEQVKKELDSQGVQIPYQQVDVHIKADECK